MHTSKKHAKGGPVNDAKTYQNTKSDNPRADDRIGSGGLCSDKKDCKVVSDSQMDSGFLSGSNIMSSSSVVYEEGKSGGPGVGLDKDSDDSQDGTFCKGHSASSSDFLDSGIDLGLSERIGSLNLASSGGAEASSSSETEPTSQLDNASPERRSRLEQIGLAPVHISILKEIFKKDLDGDTQLHIAVMRGFIEVVWHITRLIPHQALLDIINNHGKTALHLAVANGDARLARHLIICGASPVARNQRGDTPLHLACRNGDASLVSFLTSQVTVYEVVSARLSYPPSHTPGLLAADLNNYDGQTCIHVAAQGSHLEILQHLVWYGADINAKECKCGRTALHYAVEARDVALVKFLVESCRAALNIQTYAGLTPYQLALANDAPIIATLLESLGARKEPFPSSVIDEDLETNEVSRSLGPSWTVDDLQVEGVPFALAGAVPVSSHSPINADHFL